MPGERKQWPDVAGYVNRDNASAVLSWDAEGNAPVEVVDAEWRKSKFSDIAILLKLPNGDYRIWTIKSGSPSFQKMLKGFDAQVTGWKGIMKLELLEGNRGNFLGVVSDSVVKA